ncbi:Hypothetical protein POVN_LOCUS466 [uncultured virus]|nr:Hypothetical protein POVN_LOCUS466 [uncultured virus]
MSEGFNDFTEEDDENYQFGGGDADFPDDEELDDEADEGDEEETQELQRALGLEQEEEEEIEEQREFPDEPPSVSFFDQLPRVGEAESPVGVAPPSRLGFMAALDVASLSKPSDALPPPDVIVGVSAPLIAPGQLAPIAAEPLSPLRAPSLPGVPAAGVLAAPVSMPRAVVLPSSGKRVPIPQSILPPGVLSPLKPALPVAAAALPALPAAAAPLVPASPLRLPPGVIALPSAAPAKAALPAPAKAALPVALPSAALPPRFGGLLPPRAGSLLPPSTPQRVGSLLPPSTPQRVGSLLPPRALPAAPLLPLPSAQAPLLPLPGAQLLPLPGEAAKPIALPIAAAKAEIAGLPVLAGVSSAELVEELLEEVEMDEGDDEDDVFGPGPEPDELEEPDEHVKAKAPLPQLGLLPLPVGDIPSLPGIGTLPPADLDVRRYTSYKDLLKQDSTESKSIFALRSWIAEQLSIVPFYMEGINGYLVPETVIQFSRYLTNRVWFGVKYDATTEKAIEFLLELSPELDPLR